MVKGALSKKIYTWEGILFNLLCACYFLLLAPYIQTISIANIKGGTPIPWFGVLLLIISIAETYAFPKKMKYVHKAIQDHHDVFGNGFFLWMFHTVISILITFSALASFGYDISPDSVNQPSNIVLFLPFFIVIKELYLLFTMMGMHDENDSLEAYKRPNQKEWVLDLILLSYACLAYTATWSTFTANMSMERDNMAMYMLNCVVASILFLIFYMPLRIPYYLEEIAQLKTNKEVFRFVLSILLVLISVITHL